MPSRSLRRSIRRGALGTAAGLLLLPAMAACGDDGAAGSGRQTVVAGFYPLQFAAERVGGSHVAVDNLAKPGVEPHDIELSPSQVGQLADAKLVLYLKGFQPELDKAIGQNAADHALDVATVTPLIAGSAHQHEGEGAGAAEADANALDPHVWLDPTRLATITDAVATRLGQIDPAHAQEFQTNAAALHTELTKLDADYAAGLTNCQRHEIVTSHAAFGYLADRYHLEQIALSGLTPDAEPSPQHLAEVAAAAKAHGATTIFFETLVSPKVAETLASEVGAKTAVLDPLEGLSEGSSSDYLSVMRSNLEVLRQALGCA